MTKKRDIFERLALREKVIAMSRADTIRTLDEEYQKISAIGDKLTEMAAETQLKPGTTSMMALRSAKHYGGKISEQVKLIESRKGFLETEINDEQIILSQALIRKNRATDKSRQYQQMVRDQKEEKADTDVPRSQRHAVTKA